MIRQFQTSTLFALLLLMSCSGHQLNTSGPFIHRIGITLNAPTGLGKDAPLLAGGQMARFTADITGVNGPFNISWNFGGAAENTASTLAVQGTSTLDVELLRNSGEQTYTATATVVDGAGVSQSDSVTFNVLGWSNDPPVIDDVTLGNEILSVTASDADGDALSFSAMFLVNSEDLGPPDHVDGNTASWDLSDVGGPTPSLNDILVGGSFLGGIRVTVEDDFGASTFSDDIGGSFEAFPLEDDTLYAIATQSKAKVGDKVRIVVATGDTAHPFLYMNGVGVTCDLGASYVIRSVDYGEIDSDPDYDMPIDGVWQDGGATGFLYDGFGFIHDEITGNNRIRTDFSIIPLGAEEFQANGILFNFEYVFTEPGTFTLGFEDINVVSRTYYQDSTAAEDLFWSDIDNDHPYNTIVVEE